MSNTIFITLLKWDVLPINIEYPSVLPLTAAFSLLCLEIRLRNEEAINSTRNRIYSLKVFYFILYRRRYLFLKWFSTRVSDDQKYMCGRRLYACINTRTFKGLDAREVIIARDQKRDLHGTSFQSSPKINRIDITKTHWMQSKCTTILLIKILIFSPTTQ